MPRVPTPDEILKARGTFRKDRHGGRPQSDGKVPTCPEILKGESRREWTRVVENLDRLRILDQNDRGLIAAYCMAWARLHYAEQRTARLLQEAEKADQDYTQADEEKNDKKKAELSHLAGVIEKRIWRTEVSWRGAYNAFIKAADRLGVGATARARTNAAPGIQEPTNPKARFFSRGEGDIPTRQRVG